MFHITFVGNAQMGEKPTCRQADLTKDWPIVPRKGEMVSFGGNYHEVRDIYHVTDKDGHTFQVHFNCDDNDFDALLEAKEENWKQK